MSEKNEKWNREFLTSLEVITSQNKAIISLVGRIAFTEDEIKELIVKGKRQDLRDKYLKGYNACDGTKTKTEL